MYHDIVGENRCCHCSLEYDHYEYSPYHPWRVVDDGVEEVDDGVEKVEQALDGVDSDCTSIHIVLYPQSRFLFLDFFSFEEQTEDFLVEAGSDSEIIIGGLTALPMLSAGEILLNCVS